MKKLIVVFSILFLLFTVSAQQTTKELEVEEFKYKPYRASELILE